jgi:hypothetical protein
MEPKHVVEEEQEINVAYRWTHLILINVNLVQQDATIQDRGKGDYLCDGFLKKAGLNRWNQWKHNAVNVVGPF